MKTTNDRKILGRRDGTAGLGGSKRLGVLGMSRVLAVVVGLSLFVAIGCGGSPQPTAPAIEAAHDDHDDERVVHLEDVDLEQLGIEVAVAGPGRLAVTAELPGEGQVNGDQGLRLAISTLRRQLTARRDGVSQETGSAVDVVAYLEEHSTQELDVATAGAYLVRLEGDDSAEACGWADALRTWLSVHSDVEFVTG